MFGVYSYTFPAIQGQYGMVMRHMDALDIVVATSVLLNNEYTITTAQEVPEEQLEHLSMTKVL